MPEPIDADTIALLSAFLDGELGVVEEQDLLQRLEQEPALQDALDALASQLALTQRVIGSMEADGDLLGGVLAGLPPEAVDGPEGATVLSWLLADGEADGARQSRVDELIDREADAVTDSLAFVDVTRLAAAAPEGAVSAHLSRLPDLVTARVERTERGWSLAAGAADGALSATETDELATLVGVDADLLDSLQHAVAARVHEAGAHRAIGDALSAFATSPQVARLAEKAGSAALQAIAANTAIESRVRPAAAGTTSTSTTTSVSLWARVRLVFAQTFVPVAAASAAAAAFFVLGAGEPDVAGPATGGHLAEVQRALYDVLEPVVLAQNTMLANAVELPVISDNTADVEAIDASGTTMVFETAASNITVIWVAGLDDEDERGEQGT